jgi:hypothetical protein
MSDERSLIHRPTELLLSGCGFNAYQAADRARADDLLVREQAAGALSAAVGSLSAVHTSYRLRFIPPPTRENPFPPPERSRRAAALLVLRDRVGRMASAIRGMSAPSQDAVWRRIRSEASLLNQLLSVDYLLIEHCGDIRDAAAALTPETWDQGAGEQEIGAALARLETLIRERQQALQFL